mmetsp:Transcript_28836/g.47762  ORF Transcript_28836/g.47762 Transcript_28836/m.47762 type:complete len:132 (-) Transcript_28836:537-932(-)|eukprot:CAMPEP_0119303312 /NCGR_PEP_ID=MMETSP1333-20130426/4767_1 /TAXON_ID=418940 /ORGANISM="Scyphosphaera apsteinii, Strain RCC1455" /LENGTH=131 /DNA_ID=CAMNT_0007305955 /DNA_START=126 /DNA_END=521 /DNA_ORIENTATION=+
MRGEVIIFHANRGWGFIKRDDAAPDIFVHQTNIQANGFRSLSQGQIVEFDEEMHGGRMEAMRVRLCGADNRRDIVEGTALAQQHVRVVKTNATPTSFVPRAISKQKMPAKRQLKQQASTSSASSPSADTEC